MSHSSILTSDPLLSASELDLRRVNISPLEAAFLRLRLQPFKVMGTIETVICFSRLLILYIFVKPHMRTVSFTSDSQHSTDALTRPRTLAFSSLTVLVRNVFQFPAKDEGSMRSRKVKNTISQQFIYIFSAFRNIRHTSPSIVSSSESTFHIFQSKTLKVLTDLEGVMFLVMLVCLLAGF